MKQLTFRIVVSQFVLGTVGILLSYAVHADSELNADEIRALFENHTVSAYHELKKAPVNLFYDSNGEVRGIFANGKRGTTKWHVGDKGNICLTVKTKNLCFLVIERSGNYYKYLQKDDGQRVLVFSMETFLQGNIHRY